MHSLLLSAYGGGKASTDGGVEVKTIEPTRMWVRKRTKICTRCVRSETYADRKGKDGVGCELQRVQTTNSKSTCNKNSKNIHNNRSSSESRPSSLKDTSMPQQERVAGVQEVHTCDACENVLQKEEAYVEAGLVGEKMCTKMIRWYEEEKAKIQGFSV